MLRYVFLFFIGSISTLFIFSRKIEASQKVQRYTVSWIPRKLNYNPEQLNLELKNATTRDEARKIIKLKQFKNARIIILERVDGNPPVWWFISTEQYQEKSEEFDVLRSKGRHNYTVEELSDLKELITDTLVLLDTINIRIKLRDQSHKGLSYLLKFSCSNEGPYTLVDKDPSLIYLFPEQIRCKERYVRFELLNGIGSKTLLASAVIFRPDEDDKDMLKHIFNDWRQAHPDHTIKELEEFYLTVLTRMYGRVLSQSLSNWMHKME